MTLAEIIIARHAPAGTVVRADAMVQVSVDRVYAQDGNVPTLRRLFAEHGFDHVSSPATTHFVMDHSTLSPDRTIATRVSEAEAFARALGVDLIRAGEGISHLVAKERGWFSPGSIVLGADSHTCTGGAWLSLSLGMGATDILAAMLTGKTWLKVPHTIGIETFGRPRAGVGAKDVILSLLGAIDPTTFIYRSIEWSGDWVSQLPDDAAATIANMSVELGAKCGFVRRPGIDDDLLALCPPVAASHRIDLAAIEPQVSGPHHLHACAPVSTLAGMPVHYVFIGSCANARFDDLAAAAAILRGRSISPTCRLVVTPGTRDILLRAMRAGIIEDIVEAGGLVSPPGCGACVGAQGHVPADGDVVVSTMNRNFKGRMGNPDAQQYIASPVVAAATAVLGRLPSLAEIEELSFAASAGEELIQCVLA